MPLGQGLGRGGFSGVSPRLWGCISRSGTLDARPGQNVLPEKRRDYTIITCHCERNLQINLPFQNVIASRWSSSYEGAYRDPATCLHHLYHEVARSGVPRLHHACTTRGNHEACTTTWHLYHAVAWQAISHFKMSLRAYFAKQSPITGKSNLRIFQSNHTASSGRFSPWRLYYLYGRYSFPLPD
jgi:hypothetical protein